MSKFRTRFAQLSLMVFAVIVAASPDRVEAQQTKSAGPTGTISGHVSIGDSPARGVTVSLNSNDVTMNRGAGVHTKTDESGAYQFTGIGPGQYFVQAFAPALVPAGSRLNSRPGKPVSLAAGDNVDGVDLVLNPGGVITGRVTTVEGHPLVQENIRLYQFIDGKTRFPVYIANNYMSSTDDRGDYRLFGLVPGEYIICVGYDKDDPVSTVNSSTVSPLTYYPDASEESKAVRVAVVAGGEVTGIDIVVGKPAAGFSVSGKIINSITGKPVPGLQFGYKPIDINHAPLGRTGTTSNSRGEFHFTGVVPGNYVAFAYPQSDSDLYSDVVPFVVSNDDVKGLLIKINPGSTITGNIVIEGVDAKTAASKLSDLTLVVRAGSLNTVTQSNSLKISADGSFRVGGLPRGMANFYVAYPIPKGVNLARIELDDVEQKNGIEVGANQEISGVKIVMSYGDGSIRGETRFEGGKRAPGSLFHASIRKMNDPFNRNQKAGEVDDRGRFFFDALPPGDYEVSLIYQFNPNKDSPDLTKPLSKIVKQTIKVTNGIETPVTLVIDLSDTNR